MSFCPVDYDTTQHYARMDRANQALERSLDEGIEVAICDKCGLFFSRYAMAPSYKCGRCLDPKKYPWVAGKREKWTGGAIYDAYNVIEIENERDPDIDRGEKGW